MCSTSSCIISILPFGGAFWVGRAQADDSVLAAVDVASGLVLDAHAYGVPDLQVKHLRGVGLRALNILGQCDRQRAVENAPIIGQTRAGQLETKYYRPSVTLLSNYYATFTVTTF